MGNYLNMAEDRLKTIELNYAQQNTAPTSKSNDGLWNRMLNNLTSIAFGTPTNNSAANNSVANNTPNNVAVSYAPANTLSRSAPTTAPVPHNSTGYNLLSQSVSANPSRVNNNNNSGAVNSRAVNNNNSVNMNVNKPPSQQSDPQQVSRALDSLKSKFIALMCTCY